MNHYIILKNEQLENKTLLNFLFASFYQETKSTVSNDSVLLAMIRFYVWVHRIKKGSYYFLFNF